MISLLPLVHLLALPAEAQENKGVLDAHGFTEAANDGEILDPLTLYRAEDNKPGVVSLGGLFEYASDPLVEYAANGDANPLLGTVAALNLTGSFGLSRFASVGFAAPYYFVATGADGKSARPLLGDVRLSLPLSMVSTSDGTGFNLGVVPYADLPTGEPIRWLGNSGLSGGALVAGRYGGTKWDLDGNFGFRATPHVNFQNLHGDTHALFGLGFAYALMDTMGIRVEGLFQPNLTPAVNEADRGTLHESPGEVTLSLRGRYPSGLSWTVGGAKSFTPAVSAANYRIFAGVGWTFGKQVDKDTDGDGLLDKVDQCPNDPEIVNHYHDEDGCPDHLADINVAVVDSAGKPLSGASVDVGGTVFTTDASGQIVDKDQMPGTSVTVKATLVGHEPGQVGMTLVEGPNTQTIALADAAAPVTAGKLAITVTCGDKPVDANIVFHAQNDKTGIPSVQTGDDGAETVPMPAGKYSADIAATGCVNEHRDGVEVTVDQTAQLNVAMKAAAATITKREIEINDHVNFDTGSDVIKAESYAILDQVAQVMKDNPQVTKFEVQGHTDDRGSDSSNMVLSQHRAEAVVKYLVGKGIDSKRLTAKGYGETKPLVPNASDEARYTNRRVQFVILEQAAVPDNGRPPPTPAPAPAPSPAPAPAPATTPSGGTPAPAPAPAPPAPAPAPPAPAPAPPAPAPAPPAPAPAPPAPAPAPPAPAPAPTTPSGGTAPAPTTPPKTP